MAVKPNKYRVVLETFGKKYKGEGTTLEDALANLHLSWEQIKGKGIMKVNKGKYNYEHLFNAIVLRRIVSSKLARMTWAKNLNLFLKSDKETNIPK